MMRTCNGNPIGVCSWSLGSDVDVLAALKDRTGLDHIHLATGPALDDGGMFIDAIQEQGWIITATMVGFPQEDYSTLDAIRRTGGIAPDAEWPANKALFLRALDVTVALNVPYLTMHAGFIDHTDPSYTAKFYSRIRCLADACGEKGVMLLMETGQESAAELKDFMEEIDHSALGINFDPANMILYDKDAPVDAVRVLAPWIKHLHVKDAVRTTVSGEWGAEVPWGDGQVGPTAFLAALEEIGFDGAMAIEREAGDDRVADISLAVERLTAL